MLKVELSGLGGRWAATVLTAALRFVLFLCGRARGLGFSF